MANIAAALRQEITRLARREIRRETAQLRQATARFRKDRADLRKRVAELEQLVSKLKRALPVAPDPTPADLEGLRYSTRTVRANRKRLGLSAADFAALCGVSEQTVYNWEHGSTRPDKKKIAVLVSLRSLGRRAAKDQLERLEKGAR